MRIQVVGGNPTPEELAALAVALSAAADADAAQRLEAVLPAWLVAARLEAVGSRTFAAPADFATRP